MYNVQGVEACKIDVQGYKKYKLCKGYKMVLFGTADVLVLNRENDVVAVVDITSNEELCTVCNSTDTKWYE